MDDTVEHARQVVVSVTPRLLCDSLVTLLADHGLDVAAASDETTRPGQIAVVGRDTDVAADIEVVVRLLTDVAGTPTAVVHACAEGPSVRIEGMPAIIRTIVDLARGTGEGHVRQGQ